MILDFYVQNFRSLKDAATLSFVASPDSSLRSTHCLATGIKSVPWVTRAAAIYGANASGKSNLIFGLASMSALVRQSTALNETQFAELYTPFRLDKESAAQPTEFEVNLLLNGVRYEYGFSYDSQRIRGEWLTVYRTGKGQKWFDREWDEDRGADLWGSFSTHFSGPRETWRKATRPQALFLTTAAQLNSDLLKPLFDWFSDGLLVLNTMNALGSLSLGFTLTRFDEDGFKERVLEVMRAADIHIADIKIEKKPGQQLNFSFELGKTPTVMAREGEVPEVTFGHKVKDGETVYFDRRFESAGTQMLFACIGFLLEAIEKGKLLVIDDVDSSLHPMVTRFIVGLFHDPAVSKKDAQLWMTTHDTSLLDTDVMRRDQFWFVDKDERQASVLVPLTDFSPRRNEALERGYLRGRYGGVPFISSLRH
jgi:AAA15 family ATPase/GTPase